MPESIISSERVRSMSEHPRRVAVEIEGSVTYEIPLNIWATFNEKDTNTAKDLGANWHKRLTEKTSDELADRIRSLGGPWCAAWLAVGSFLLAAPPPHDPGRVFAWLSQVDDNRLRRWIIGYVTHNENQALIELAAAGDMDAARQLLGERADEKPELVDHLKWMIEADDLAAQYADTLSKFRAEVFSDYEDEFAAVIARAAAGQTAAPSQGDAKEMVEAVTGGIDFEIPAGTSRVVLIPSMVTRPLSLIDVYRGTVVNYYGIPDEYIDGDPDAPPTWLVRTYKALGDERRLRIMRRLSQGPASLDDLTELLSLSKSTVHHHIALLRAAGLIRVHIPAEKSSATKTYSLRTQSLGDARGFLDSYLTHEETEDAV